MPGLPGQKLICLDFDYTMVMGHFHSTLASNSIPALYDGNNGAQVTAAKHWASQLVNAFGFKNPKQLIDMIQQALRNGHKVAITSYSAYPLVIEESLRILLKDSGLSQDEIASIHVVGGFPYSNAAGYGIDATGQIEIDKTFGKELHIAEAQEHFNKQGCEFTPGSIVLADDDVHNVSRARAAGHVGIDVPGGSATYFEGENPTTPGYIIALQLQVATPVMFNQQYSNFASGSNERRNIRIAILGASNQQRQEFLQRQSLNSLMELHAGFQKVMASPETNPTTKQAIPAILDQIMITATRKLDGFGSAPFMDKLKILNDLQERSQNFPDTFQMLIKTLPLTTLKSLNESINGLRQKAKQEDPVHTMGNKVSDLLQERTMQELICHWFHGHSSLSSRHHTLELYW